MVVVPVFYGTYTALGLVNTIIYLDEIGNYPPWAIVLVFVGIGVLIYGVYLLSSKPDPAHLNESEDNLQELGDMSSDNSDNETASPINHQWLSAKDEKEAAAAAATNTAPNLKNIIGESSSSLKQEDNTSDDDDRGGRSRIHQFFRKLKYFTVPTHHQQQPRREMDTFISLHSQAETTTTNATTIIPLSITQSIPSTDHNYNIKKHDNTPLPN